MECERAAEAIALHACALAPIGLLLGIEEFDERRRILVDCGVGQGGLQAEERLDLLRIVEIERTGHDRRPLGPVEGVRHQHDIAFGSESASHVPEYWT